MDVSVIIPTYNGAHKLPGIIAALKSQSFKLLEVVVVVDGSTDNTIEVLEALQADLPILKIVTQENRGRGVVRNTGAEHAQGDLLVLFDDDMHPLRDCVEKHVQHHQAHPGSVLTGGVGEPADGNSPDILKYKSYLSKKWDGQLKTEKGRLLKGSIFVNAANCSISKNDFVSLGGFDCRLNDAEDFDFAVRAFKAGVPLYFRRDVFAWHNEVITCRKYIKRQRQYTQANKKLIQLKPWLETDQFMIPTKKPIGWRKLVFQLFLNKMWIKAVDSHLFSFLPQAIRFKLYDLIITANGVFYPHKVSL
jgi:glycosyltransferase involved in cell wall biosynthesis